MSKKRKFDYSPRRSRSSYSGSSDEDVDGNHFEGKAGDILLDRYRIKRIVGKGTFATVFKCADMKHKDDVAIKAVRKVDRYTDSARIEADILNNLYDKQKEVAADFCVDLYSTLIYDGHYFLVFEALGHSLYDIIKRNNYKSLPLHAVKSVSKQMLEALVFLRSANLIHADLKLENVVFVHNTMHVETITRGGKSYEVSVPTNPRIKIIDFGAATYDNDRHKSTIINTRQYRGPEVTLEIGWSFPSDVWSVGCILAEIYAGELLFETHDELEHLALIEKSIGSFPKHIVFQSKHARKFFHRDGLCRTEDLSADSWRAVREMMYIEEFFDFYSCDYEEKEVNLMCELVSDMLAIDPSRREAPAKLLRSPLFDLTPNLAAAAAAAARS